MNKIRILALVNGGGSKYFRVVLPLDLLPKEKYEVTYLNEKFFLEHVVKDYDYIYIHWIQMTNPVYLSLWKEKYGFKIIQDIDDYWQLPNSHHLKEKLEKSKPQLFNQLILADLVLCSTPFLLEKCLKYNDNCHLRENYIPIGYYQFQPELKLVKNEEKIKVGICGSISHLNDWLSIRNQLKRILNDKFIADNYEFVIAGYADDNQSSKEMWDKVVNLFTSKLIKPTIIKHLPVNEYINLYNHLDVLLAPLEDNEFNKAKSGLKLMESSVKSTIVISNDIYKEKGFVDYLSTSEYSYYEWLRKLTNRNLLDNYKVKFQKNLLEISNQYQTKYNLEQLIKKI